MIKLVVIDFDDTLSLTEEATYHMENKIAVEMGHPPMERAAHLKNWGKPLEQAVAERVPGVDVEEYMKRIQVLHSEYAADGKVDVVSDVNLSVLDEFLEKDMKLAILTARDSSEVAHLLSENHPINSRIERIYHRGNSEFLKPDPKAFLQILKDFDVPASNAVYIGDAITDAECAKRAGLHFIAFMESGLRTQEDFKDKNVDFFATTLTEAKNYIFNN